MEIREYMRGVPEMDRFLTVDELDAALERIASEHPGIARRRRVGSSKLGEPIHMLSIGSGETNVLLFACPHPNEPIGAMLVHHLAHLLVDDAALRDGLGFTWHLIPSVDPDGTRLNEGWFNGPFTIPHYARHFYRPAGDQQVEWTFPNFYKTNYYDRTLPESEMLMRVIDELQPVLMGSLHNAGFGGVYYYLSRDVPELHGVFHAMPGWEGLPLRLGEAEVPYAEEFAPAIYRLITTEDSYDYMAANGADLSKFEHGGSSAGYAARHGTLTLVIEMAYFDDPRVNDQTVTESNRREAILAGLARSEAMYAEIEKHLEAVRDDLKTDSVFEAALRWFARMAKQTIPAERQWAGTDPSTDRSATVAELFSNDQEARSYGLLIYGMLLRMLEGEIAVGNGTPKIRQARREALASFEERAAALEHDLDVRAVPIRKLVAVQLGAVIAAARQLATVEGSQAASAMHTTA